jgi:hypothetical protein
MSRATVPPAWRASPDDARAIAQLHQDFNLEFDEPTPTVEALERRVAHLLRGGDTLVLLIGADHDGLAVLRFREAIWSSGLECYLASSTSRPHDAETDLAAPSWKQPYERPEGAAQTRRRSASTNPI